MQKSKIKTSPRIRRHKRIRSRIFGTAERPRLCIFRSHRFLELQLIDDTKGHTLASAHVPLKKSSDAGKTIAVQAKKWGIVKAVFDRGGYAFHGHVQEAAQGARDGGLVI
ncbi:MAG: 50S ribosomal protein L18 [Patescibacteria group bacterium]|jgi:large subunit ribosomal protein L18